LPPRSDAADALALAITHARAAAVAAMIARSARSATKGAA
jgi:Holliday junction resolvasome RuvABC endonuclease subunit